MSDLATKKPYILVKNIQEGISQKTQKPYRIVTIANPDTLENFTFSADPSIVIPPVKKGDRINFTLEMENMFNNTRFTIIDIYPVK